MSEAVIVRCNNCGARLKLKDESSLGQQINCPKCKTAFVGESESAPAKARKKPKQAKSAELPPAEPPKKKKKKKRKPSGIPLPALIGGGLLLAVLLVGASVALAVKLLGGGGAGSSAAAAPASYATYNVSEGAFRVSYPDTWEKETGGKTGHYWARFKSGNSMIKVNESTVGSLISDVGGGGHERGREEYSIVEALHAQKKEFYADEMKGYEEGPGEGFTTQFGKAWRTPFTYPTTFSGSYHGIRATFVGTTRQLDVVCTCPPGDWETLKPVFIKCLESVSLGMKE